MSYSNMEDYIDMSRIERYQTSPKQGKFDLARVLKRDSTEMDLSAYWGKGIQMDWSPVPLEDQKCHINWRQSINDDGSSISRLASWPQNEKWAGGGSSSEGLDSNGNGSGPGAESNIFVKNHKAMENSASDEDLKEAIQAGKDHVQNNSDSVLTEIKNKYNNMKDSVGNQEGLDPLAIFCYATAKGSENYTTIIADMKKKSEEFGGTKNPAILIPAFDLDNDLLKYAVDGQEPPANNSSSDTTTSGSGSGSSSTTKPTKPPVPTITSSSKNIDADWCVIMKQYFKWGRYLAGSSSSGSNGSSSSNSSFKVDKDKLSVFPKVCYMYVQIMPLLGVTADVIDREFAKWEGKTMPAGRNGCCQAVVRIGSGFNAFLKKEYDKGQSAVNGLLPDMKSAGIPVVNFSNEEAKPGDVIFYQDKKFEQDHQYAHVMMVDGKGGCVGNSSERQQVVRQSKMDYWSGFWPQLLGKTSSHGLT